MASASNIDTNKLQSLYESASSANPVAAKITKIKDAQTPPAYDSTKSVLYNKMKRLAFLFQNDLNTDPHYKSGTFAHKNANRFILL